MKAFSVLSCSLGQINTIFGIGKYNSHNIWYVKVKNEIASGRVLPGIGLRRVWEARGG